MTPIACGAGPGLNVTIWCRDGSLCSKDLTAAALQSSKQLPSDAYLASRPHDWKLPAEYINFGSASCEPPLALTSCCRACCRSPCFA